MFDRQAFCYVNFRMFKKGTLSRLFLRTTVACTATLFSVGLASTVAGEYLLNTHPIDINFVTSVTKLLLPLSLMCGSVMGGALTRIEQLERKDKERNLPKTFD